MGKSLRKVAGPDSLYRSVFEIRYRDHDYAVEVDFLDWNEHVQFYVDGALRTESTSPASFDLGEGAKIEVKIAEYGLEYARLVDTAVTTDLRPAEGTGEAWRANLDREHPVVSRAIGLISWSILALAAVVTIPDLLQILASWLDWDFDVPALLAVSQPWDVILDVAAILAGIERGLRLKSGEFL